MHIRELSWEVFDLFLNFGVALKLYLTFTYYLYFILYIFMYIR